MTDQSQDVDELIDVKNSYYVGNFQTCITEALKLKTSSIETQIEKDVFMYRSYIAQKRFVIVKEEISNNSPLELQCLKVLAEYLSSTPDQRSTMVEVFNQKFVSYCDSNHLIAIIAATVYIYEDELEKAVMFLYNHEHLETISLVLQIYLRMNQSEFAKKELKKMIEKDEDAVLTQLAQAWVNISEGKDKTQDACYTFEEMIDRYGATPQLLNGQAVCFINQEKYEEAEDVLQSAMSKDSNNPETLINLILLSAHIPKHEEVMNRYLAQLKESYPHCQFIKEYTAKEVEFDRLCLEYEIPASS